MVPLDTYTRRFDRPELWSTARVVDGLAASAVMAFLVALGTWVPVTRDVIQLRSALALGCIVPWMAASVAIHVLRSRPATASLARTVVIGGSACLHLYGQTLVVDSGTWPARFLFGVILLATMGSHGNLLRVTWDAPYFALTTTAFLGLSLLRCHDSEVRTYLAILHLCGLFVMVTLGGARNEGNEQLARLGREQEALAASLLAQSHSAAALLEHQVTELMGAHHDARNLLANALLKSELLRWKLDKEDVVLSNLEIKNTLTHVSDALKLVSSVFKESLRPESPGETFAARPVLDKHIADFRQKKPGIPVQFTASADVSLNLPGGPVTFRRILDNLLLNAAEGDGKRGALGIWLDATCEEGKLHVRLADDGPGFPDEVLASTRQRFTRKQDGSGLGLLTVDSLVRACSGVLQLSNRPQGGAQVDVFLPVVDAATVMPESVPDSVSHA